MERMKGIDIELQLQSYEYEEGKEHTIRIVILLTQMNDDNIGSSLYY
jgi:hypothetical protein